MGFRSKDGKAFGNHQQMKAYEERTPKKESEQHEAAESPEYEAGEQEGMSEMPIEEHVAEHGPAEKVMIEHHEGKHTKTSHHGGAMHKSEHESAEEAHHHGMIAAGVQPHEEQQEPAMSGAMPEGIPGY